MIPVYICFSHELHNHQENDCVDIEVFFDTPTSNSNNKALESRAYATWQYVSSACCVAIIAVVNSGIFT